jgi:hypothetical protein
MQPTAVKHLLLSASLTCAGATLLCAQVTVHGDPFCDGKRVSRVEIRPGRPPFEGTMSRWRHAARAVGLHHATTRPGVIKAFLALDEGEICTEIRREESERILRAQPFIGNASVRAVPDGSGGVVIIVATVDEVPVLVNGRFRGISPRALSLGNTNVGGEGLLIQANVEKGYAYPTGFGGRIVEYATFGRPYVSSFEGEKFAVGYHLATQLEHPFYTDIQRIGWHAGLQTGDEYPRLRRPADDQLAILMRETRWEVSALARVFGTSTVGLVGAGVNGIRLNPAQAGIVISDTGITTDTGIALRNRYNPVKAVRVGVLGGLRRVTFRSVRGFDALAAQQDVPNGLFAGLFAAKGVPSFGDNDLFLSGVAFGGAGGPHTFLASYAQMEGRRSQAASQWDGLVGSSRTALYLGGGPGWLLVLDDQFSGGQRALLPLQLALGDRQGGIIGYYNSPLAGAYRNVARGELRYSYEALVRGADVGFATFTEVGSLWAGDAPYGSTATRTSVGFSILAAYPSGSKRLYRVDVGIPLQRVGEGGGRLEVRFTTEDNTLHFWREPDDVLRARTGGLPSAMFAFPTR